MAAGLFRQLARWAESRYSVMMAGLEFSFWRVNVNMRFHQVVPTDTTPRVMLQPKEKSKSRLAVNRCVLVSRPSPKMPIINAAVVRTADESQDDDRRQQHDRPYRFPASQKRKLSLRRVTIATVIVS